MKQFSLKSKFLEKSLAVCRRLFPFWKVWYVLFQGFLLLSWMAKSPVQRLGNPSPNLCPFPPRHTVGLPVPTFLAVRWEWSSSFTRLPSGFHHTKTLESLPWGCWGHKTEGPGGPEWLLGADSSPSFFPTPTLPPVHIQLWYACKINRHERLVSAVGLRPVLSHSGVSRAEANIQVDVNSERFLHLTGRHLAPGLSPLWSSAERKHLIPQHS